MPQPQEEKPHIASNDTVLSPIEVWKESMIRYISGNCTLNLVSAVLKGVNMPYALTWKWEGNAGNSVELFKQTIYNELVSGLFIQMHGDTLHFIMGDNCDNKQWSMSVAVQLCIFNYILIRKNQPYVEEL